MSRPYSILFLSLSLLPVALEAEPYIAFREGYRCSACHTNRTGGGKRNEFGSLFTQTEMETLLQGVSRASTDFSPELGEFFSLGLDLIATHETTAAVSGKLQTSDSLYYSEGANTFDIRSANLYLEVNLAPERLSIYFDEVLGPNGASNREAFVLIDALPAMGYLKVGRFLPPFGIRIGDDESFIRKITGFNFANQDLGLEIGLQAGNATLAIALSNGSRSSRDDNRSKQLSCTTSLYMRKFIAGTSLTVNSSRGTDRLALGPWAGMRIGPLTAMAEADWVMDDSAVGPQDQFLFFGSLNYLCNSAMNLHLSFDFLDPWRRLAEDESSRVSVGLNAFLTPNLQSALRYRIQKSIPQDTAGNADKLFLALHAFF